MSVVQTQVCSQNQPLQYLTEHYVFQQSDVILSLPSLVDSTITISEAVAVPSEGVSDKRTHTLTVPMSSAAVIAVDGNETVAAVIGIFFV